MHQGTLGLQRSHRAVWKQSDPFFPQEPSALGAGAGWGGGAATGAHGKNRSWRSGRKLGQKMQQIAWKRMIQAALIWICSLAKTQRWRSSLSVSGDDKRRQGKSRGSLQLQHLGNDAGTGAAPRRGPAPALINHREKGLSSPLVFL